MRSYYLFILSSIVCFPAFSQENNVVYPSGTNVVNVVTDLGVDNEGDVSKATSNTAILQRAILDHKGGGGPNRGAKAGRIMYFPNGIYYINAPIESMENIIFAPDRPGGQTNAGDIHYQGQSESGTIIRIVDGSPAFRDAANPKYAISYYQGNAGNNDAFNNTMEDMTINIGNNNPGAGGIEFTSNNVGTIRNVTVKSEDGQGVIGIKMSANLNGLSLLSNVVVDGFTRGIYTRHNHCVIIMEDLTLNNQTEYGIYNEDKPIVINGLVSNNIVPALYSFGAAAYVTMTNSTFNAPQAVTETAVQIKDGAASFLRNLQSSNYENIATVNEEMISGNEISEYAAHLVDGQPIKLWGNVPNTSLDLKLEEEMVTSLKWTDVSNIHVIPAGDTDNDSPMIQEQLNLAASQGKTHVMFASNGRYKLRDRIIVPAEIRRITGNWAYFNMSQPVRNENGESLFYFEASNHDVVMLEKMLTPFGYLANREAGHTNGGYFIENVMDGSTTLYLRDMFINYPYYRGKGNGKVYIENVNVGGAPPTLTDNFENPLNNGDVYNLQRPGIDIMGQTFLGKHVDVEMFNPNLKFTDATVKIQGFKVGEKHGDHFVMENSTVEILGGVVNGTSKNGDVLPEAANVLEITDSEVTFVAHERASDPSKLNRIPVIETQGNLSRTLDLSILPDRGSSQGKVFTMYRTALDPTNALPTNTPKNNEPVTVIESSKAVNPITLDGNLEEAEWATKYTISKSVIGTANNKASFGVTWDDTNIYIGVSVEDAEVFSEGIGEPYEDDGIEIYIDGGNDKAGNYGDDDFQFLIPYNGSIAYVSPPYKYEADFVKFKSMATALGYDTEIAIPWNSLSISPKNNYVLGLDVGINDDDNGGTRETQLVWAGTDTNWQSTSNWGVLTLKDTHQVLGLETFEEFDVYPNPTNGILKLDNSKPQDVKVFDGSGTLVLRLEKALQVDVRHLSPGLYFIFIGEKTKGKFVKE